MDGRAATVRSKQWLALVVLAVVWGTTWIATDTLDQYVPPVRGAAARFALAALFCLPLLLWRRVRLPCRRALGFALLLSVTLIDLPFVLLLWARTRVPYATVIVLFAAMPLLVAFLTPGVPRRALQATMVGLGAIALAVGISLSAAQAGDAVVVLVAVASAGASALLARREFRNVNPVMATALVLGMAALLLFPAAIALERSQPVAWNHEAIGSVVFLAAVGGAPAYATYFWLLQQMEAYQVVTVQWIEPLVAMIESALLLRVGFSFPMIAGSLVTLVSVLVVMRAQAKDDDTVSLLAG